MMSGHASGSARGGLLPRYRVRLRCSRKSDPPLISPVLGRNPTKWHICAPLKWAYSPMPFVFVRGTTSGKIWALVRGLLESVGVPDSHFIGVLGEKSRLSARDSSVE